MRPVLKLRPTGCASPCRRSLRHRGHRIPEYKINGFTLVPSRDHRIHFVLAGNQGDAYQLEASPDLVNWETLTNFTLGPIRFFDLFQSNSGLTKHQFFRGKKQ